MGGKKEGIESRSEEKGRNGNNVIGVHQKVWGKC